MADRPEEAGDQARAEDHEDRDPVRGRGEEDRAEQRHRRDQCDRGGELDTGRDDVVGPPVAGQAGDQHRRGVDDSHVRRADRDRAEPAREQQRRAADRPDDERLQQSSLGVAADDAKREKDREHRPEEERPESREAEHGRTDEGARVHARGRADVAEVLVEEVHAEPEERQEGDRQDQHDAEDLAAQGLAQAVAGDRQDGGHDVSPPTASR